MGSLFPLQLGQDTPDLSDRHLLLPFIRFIAARLFCHHCSGMCKCVLRHPFKPPPCDSGHPQLVRSLIP